MSAIIDTINTADRIARFWRCGNIPAINAQERIEALGFYAVAVGEQTIVGWMRGCRFEMPAV